MQAFTSPFVNFLKGPIILLVTYKNCHFQEGPNNGARDSETVHEKMSVSAKNMNAAARRAELGIGTTDILKTTRAKMNKIFISLNSQHTKLSILDQAVSCFERMMQPLLKPVRKENSEVSECFLGECEKVRDLLESTRCGTCASPSHHL